MPVVLPFDLKTAIPLPMDRIAEFCRKWQVVEFALFGSVLRDDFRAEDSDVDVMVTFEPDSGSTFFDLGEMEEELRRIFHRDVDLLTRRGVEESLNWYRRRQILNGARVIYGG